MASSHFSLSTSSFPGVRLFLRLLPLVVAVLATTLVALHSTDVLVLDRSQLTISIAVLAVVSLIEGLERAIGGVVREHQLTQARHFSETLRALLVNLVDASQVDWTSIGVNALLVRKRYRWFGRESLHRVGRERIRSTPRHSDVVWTRGKGVIGRCWERGQDYGSDLRAIYADIAGMSEQEWSNLGSNQPGITEEDWAQFSVDKTFGLSYADFLRTRHHRVVVATPILDRAGRVIGVVSADSRDAGLDQLFTDEVRGVLGSAAETIRNLLE